jgi:hypothetical protein
MYKIDQALEKAILIAVENKGAVSFPGLINELLEQSVNVLTPSVMESAVGYLTNGGLIDWRLASSTGPRTLAITQLGTARLNYLFRHTEVAIRQVLLDARLRTGEDQEIDINLIAEVIPLLVNYASIRQIHAMSLAAKWKLTDEVSHLARATPNRRSKPTSSRRC